MIRLVYISSDIDIEMSCMARGIKRHSKLDLYISFYYQPSKLVIITCSLYKLLISRYIINKLLFAGFLLQVNDHISAVLFALEAREVHLSLRNILLGVEQVLEQGLFSPSDACILRLIRDLTVKQIFARNCSVTR